MNTANASKLRLCVAQAFLLALSLEGLALSLEGLALSLEGPVLFAPLTVCAGRLLLALSLEGLALSLKGLALSSEGLVLSLSSLKGSPLVTRHSPLPS